MMADQTVLQDKVEKLSRLRRLSSLSGVVSLVSLSFFCIFWAISGFSFSTDTGLVSFVVVAFHFLLGLSSLLVCLVTSAQVRSKSKKAFGSVSEEKRRSPSTISIRFSFSLVLFSLSVLLVATLIALKGVRHTWDITESSVHSLHYQTSWVLELATKVLNDSEPSGARALEVILVQKGGPAERAVRETLVNQLNREIQKTSSDLTFGDRSIRVTTVDAARSPFEIEGLGLTAGMEGTVRILESGDVVSERKLRELNEREIRDAIFDLFRISNKPIYLIFGLGEPEIGSESPSGLLVLRELLASHGYPLKLLPALEMQDIPEDALALIVIAGKSPLPAAAVGAVRNFTAAGGSLLVAAGPSQAEFVNAVLPEGVISIEPEIVFDISSAIGSENPLMVYSQSAPELHPAIGALPNPQRGYMLDKVATVSYRSSAEWSASPLIFSPERALARRLDAPLEGPFFTRQSRDRGGPHTLAVAIEGAVADQTLGRIVVSGSTEWLSNRLLPVTFNQDLLLNTMRWLSLGSRASQSVGNFQDEFNSELSPIIDRQVKGYMKPLNQQQFLLLLMASLLLLEMIIAAGLLMSWQRSAMQTFALREQTRQGEEEEGISETDPDLHARTGT